MMTTPKTRALGCLFGQCVGDSLGSSFEFQSSKMASSKIDNAIQQNDGFLPFLGGGPFSLGRGRITDDTEMALGLARALAVEKKASAKEVYRKWLNSWPPDIGITTRNALSSQMPSSTSLSNGALMRCSPMGIFIAGKNFDEYHTLIENDVKETHSSYDVITAVKSYIKCIKVLIESGDKTLALSEAKIEIKNNNLVKAWFEQAEQGNRLPVQLSDGRMLEKADGQSQGYIGLAYQLAFYELIHGTSFEGSLIETLKLGGDTDTNGCIVAALIGAFYGYEEIPEEWRKWILAPEMTTSGRPDNRNDVYPEGKTTDILELADKLLEGSGF